MVSQMIPNNPKQSQMYPNCLNLSQSIQNCPKLVKNWPKLSQSSISPRGQMQFCERVELPVDTESVAFNILLGNYVRNSK